MIDFFHNLPWQVIVMWEIVNPAVAFYLGYHHFRKQIQAYQRGMKVMQRELQESRVLCDRLQDELRMWWLKHGPAAYK